MKKTSLVCLTILLASSITNAGTMGALVESDPFSGAYVGLGAGFGTNIAHSSSLSGDILNSSISLNRAGNDISQGGFSGQVLGGYGQKFSNNLYLGGDIFYNYLNPILNPTEDLRAGTNRGELLYTVSERIKQSNSLGLAAHLGYVLGNFLPYGLIGAQYTPVKIVANDTITAPNVGTLPNGMNRTFNQWGWLFGAGIQTAITQHLRAALEYEYVYQNRISATRTMLANSLGPVSLTSSFNPNMSTIIARFTYGFNA